MAFDPLNDPTADPGWGKAARESLWGLIPVVSLPRRQRRIAKAVRNDGLVVTLNRPGSDGGSGYWFPTPAGSACWAA